MKSYYQKDLLHYLLGDDIEMINSFNKGEVSNFTLTIGFFTIRFHQENWRSSIWITVRTTSWDFNYERSDIHDLITTILTICLKTLGKVSPSQTVVPNIFTSTPKEIYAKYIIFERQELINFKMDKNKQMLINKIIISSYYANYLLRTYLNFRPKMAIQYEKHKINSDFEDKWIEDILKFLGEEIESDLIAYSERKNPNWKWFCSLHSGISVFKLNKSINKLLKELLNNLNYEILEGPTKKIFISENKIKNALDLEKLKRAKSLLDYIEGKYNSENIILVEDGFYLIGIEHVVKIDDDCGMESVRVELENIKKRHSEEQRYLVDFSSLVWRDRIDGERFELLIRDLLRIEPGVLRVRRVGSGSEPDGGRDLEVEWEFFNSNLITNIEGPPPVTVKTILVQCKAYKRSVGKDRVQDIRDTIDIYDAHGYLLTVSSQITAPLYDYLKKLRNKGDFWIDWWTRDEIEDRLLQNPHIITRYKDVLYLDN
ncbi:restriction endonuclease [Bacillus sp. TH12]|uniref:restriction endonuclease n=1 Tax=Bacillus sp. TH12 TaxID=2796378 RepID=UPI0019135543|nr:restriction endonuclease [Bacillus sp. TH12]MBK5503245.1 restriction endonuclease [Bacillus sp. TH12]